METIFLSPAPMPYLTDCSLKRFGINEYHCSRCCGYFVLIFMLKILFSLPKTGFLPPFIRENGISREKISVRTRPPKPQGGILLHSFRSRLYRGSYQPAHAACPGDLSARPFPAAPSAAGTPSEPDSVQPSGTAERILQTAWPAVYPGTILYAAHRRPDALPE